MKTTFGPKSAVPVPEARDFPVVVVEPKTGSKATIYLDDDRGKALHFVVFYSEGKRQRMPRREFEAAFRLAQEIVSELGAGSQDMLPLSGVDRRVYERAIDLLRPLNLSLDEVAAEAVILRTRLNGTATPVEAVDYYVKTRPKVAPNITARAVVDEFIESRKREKVGSLYLRDLKNRLACFADAFACPISVITPKEIDRYLNALNVGVRTRYNYRNTLGTLMNFAKEHGYLPLDFPGLLRNGKKRRFDREVVVFTPEDMAALLAGAKPALIPPLAITAFSGVRAEEVKRLDWCHVKLGKGHIEIPARISKTKIRRLAPITPNLRAWLAPHVQTQGRVCVYVNLSNQYLKLARKLGLSWKRNALRHSFVSYRVADINNIPQVAMESGHTVRELQTDYLEVVDQDAAKKWFSIMPSAPSNVVPMSASPSCSSSSLVLAVEAVC